MKLKLKSLIIEQFMGVTKAEYTFGDITRITGRNASGKSTIVNAIINLFNDKDYNFKNNPKVRPEFMAKSEPSITAVCDVDNKEITFRKFQTDSRTKKQIDDGAPVRITNHYEINSVPKSQTDFYAYLEEIGINPKTYLLLSHPNYYSLLKNSDGRKILFGMTSELSDKDIADSLDDCSDVAELLVIYTAEEITAMKKREAKDAAENINAIPNQIIGLEKAKVTINIDEFQIQKKNLEMEVSQMRKALEDLEIPNIGDLNQQLALLDQEERQLVANANASRVEELTKMNLHIGQLELKLRELSDAKDKTTMELSDVFRKKNSMEEEFENLKAEFDSVKKSEFEMADWGKCPTCGQNLPVHEIDKAKTAFDKNRTEKMNEINRKARDIRNDIAKYEAQTKDLDAKVKELETALTEQRAEVAKQIKIREPLEHVIDVSRGEAATNISKKRMDIRHKIANSDEKKAEAEEIQNNIRAREHAIRELDNRIAESRVNDRIDKQIAELQRKQREYGDAESSANKILAQLKEISMEKNRRLTDEINSHFSIVKFKLFEQQINGDFKDCCIPMVQAKDGTYKTFGESANTALEVRGKLDIIRGLQKFYNQYLPVLLDGAECLDSENLKQIQMDSQLITLSVVPDGDLKVEVL